MMHYRYHGQKKKRGYSTLEEAEKALYEYFISRGVRRASAYKCWCGEYHIGHTSKAMIDPFMEKNVGKIIGSLRHILNP